MDWRNIPPDLPVHSMLEELLVDSGSMFPVAGVQMVGELHRVLNYIAACREEWKYAMVERCWRFMS